MPNKNLTDIVVVMDRSGSMSSCKADAEGGLNSFIEEQRKAPGEALFTLVQFDTDYEFVHNAVPIQHVPRCFLQPRGGTALNDAVCRAINETGERLRRMKEEDRPGLVVFVILTDGGENASKEFSVDKTREMIKHQESVYNWKFTYLGANQEAFRGGVALGINLAGVAQYGPQGARGSYVAAGSSVSRMRSHTAMGLQANVGYNAAELKMMDAQAVGDPQLMVPPQQGTAVSPPTVALSKAPTMAMN